MRFQELIPSLVESSTGKMVTLTDTEYEAGLQYELIRRANGARALESVLEELSSKRLLVNKKYMVSISLSHIGKLIDGGFTPACESACAYLTAPDSSIFAAARAFDCAGDFSKTLRHLLLSSLPAIVDKNASSDSRNAVDRAFGLLLKLIPQISAHSREYGDQTGVSIHESLEFLLTELYELVLKTQIYTPIALTLSLNRFLRHFYKDLLSKQTGKETQEGIDSIVSIAALRFLANVAGCSHYKPDEITNEGATALKREGVSGISITARGDTSTDAELLQTAVTTV